MLNQEVNLNLSKKGIPPVLYMSQDDTGTRAIVATLWNGDTQYSVPQNSIVMVRFGKPDGTGGLYDHDELNNAVSYLGAVVTAPVAAQMLTASGTVRVEIDIYNSTSSTKLATFSLNVEVAPSAFPDATIISSSYFNIIAADVAYIETALPEIRLLVQSATAASEAAIAAKDDAVIAKNAAAGSASAAAGSASAAAGSAANAAASALHVDSAINVIDADGDIWSIEHKVVGDHMVNKFTLVEGT